MPRVPVYDSLQVAPNTLPQARMAAPDTPDIAGRQTQQLGQNLQRAGGEMARIAHDMAAQANQVRIDDASNQGKEAALRLAYDKDAGFLALKGINALDRPDGKSLEAEYGEALKKELDGIAGSLGNDAQRQAFAMRANDILTSFRGQAIQHTTQEYKNYSLSVSEGIQSTALREVGLNWRNPDAINSAVERIHAETYRQAQLLGKSAEWQEAAARALTSTAHKTALLSALEQNEPGYADAYLRKFSSQMNADDILTVRGHITKETDTYVGLGAADAVMRRMQPRIQVGEAERAFNIAVITESGGRHFGANGEVLTSPKGAVGIAQVMPETGPEAAALAGIPWDEDRFKTDAGYNRALGLAYFQKQLQANGGDLAKAYAAYNAGPGALKQAVQQAGDGGGNWLSLLPKETQDYVAQNLRAFEAGQGQPVRLAFAEIDDQLRADPSLASNPARYKIAREAAERRFEDQTKALKQRDDEAVATAMRGIIENGGRYSDLPIAIRAAVPPKDVDGLIGFAQKIAKGDDTTSLWLYNKLASDPAALARMSDDEFFALRKELSETDFKHFAGERAKAQGGATGGAGDLNSAAIKQSLDGRLRMLEIDPTPKDDGSVAAARVGAIRQFVDQYFMTAQREAGKKFSDAEVDTHLDALFARNETIRGWLSTYSAPMLGMKAGDIDSETRASLKAAFKRNGVDEPTDAQILNAYWNLKVTRP